MVDGGNLREFLIQFGARPRSVGAVAPSSRALAQAMVEPIDFAGAQAIVELGPGTGSITAVIAERLKPSTLYLGIEISAGFCRSLARRFPELAIVHGSAADLEHILRARHFPPVDAIVSGLPWATLPDELQVRVLSSVGAALKPGGLFVTFGYLQSLFLPGARKLRRRLKVDFASVRTTRIVWRNVPPAFAYVCRTAESAEDCRSQDQSRPATAAR